MSEIMELMQFEEKSTAFKGMEDQSWMEKLKAMCLLNRFSSSSLITSITYYARNIRTDVNECQTRPMKVEKLKDSISETLLFFLYCYRAQGEEFERTAYMDRMSDLLAMYIDVELKASKRSNELQANISARLTSYLYVCLDNSHQHLMDTLLKVQFLSSTYQQILDPLIEKILNLVPEHPASGIMYVRYFLVYRIWKRINKGLPVKNDITARARKSLRSSPSTLSEYLIDDVLPKVPNNQILTTDVLLTQKFDLEKSAENFLKFVKESRELPTVQSIEITKPEDKSNISSQSNDTHSSLILNSDKVLPKSKILTRRKSKKLDQVVVIDLTNDETNGKVLKQKRKSDGRLSWLQEAAKRKINHNNSKEDGNTEDSHKLNLVLFLTEDGNQTIIIEDQKETETSALDIDKLRLTEKPPAIEIYPSDQTKAPESHDNAIPSLSELPPTSDAEEGKITIENDTIESEIEVQMEVENELEVKTTEMNELKCEDNISENFNNEIIDDTYSASTNLAVEYQRDTVLHINYKLEESRKEILETLPEKIGNVEFPEQHIDGLSLLASVSQSVSHLSTALTSSHTNNTNREIIKVKDYKSLTEFASTNDIHSQANNSGELLSNIVGIYPDDDIDKVAFQVEIPLSEDVSDHCKTTLYDPSILEKLPNDDVNDCLNTSADCSMPSEREETNVILSGETVFLYQKSPNSNLYIINKAVENREGEETNNLSEKVLPMEDLDEVKYSYQIYDKMYRIPQPAVPQTFDDSRHAEKVKVTTSNDSARAIDLQKTVKKKTSSSIEVKSPRRHRMRQEFNACSSDLVDPHSIHIPATTSLYHTSYPTSELYISCRPNCTSVTCGLPVNHTAPPIHSHQNPSRCTCLNCRYDIVTHCTQCIIPSGESQPTSGVGIDSGYFIGIQPQSVLQDCSLKATHENNVKVFDDKSMYKIELDNDIDNKQEGIFRKTNVNSKLPLKKRFSMMSTSFEEASIKSEKPIGNYSNIPIISMATLGPNNELSTELNNHKIHTNEIIKHHYENDTINGYHFEEDRKRKHSNTDIPVSIKMRKTSTESGQISRPSKKVLEQKTPTKNSKRQTRLSRRIVPRVNYSYPDDETESNPSGESKRKRKRTNR